MNILKVTLNLSKILAPYVVDENSLVCWQEKFAKEMDIRLLPLRYTIKLSDEIYIYIRYRCYDNNQSLLFWIESETTDDVDDIIKLIKVYEREFNKQLNDFILALDDILKSGTWSVVPNRLFIVLKEFESYFVKSDKNDKENIKYNPLSIMSIEIDGVDRVFLK